MRRNWMVFTADNWMLLLLFTSGLAGLSLLFSSCLVELSILFPSGLVELSLVASQLWDIAWFLSLFKRNVYNSITKHNPNEVNKADIACCWKDGWNIDIIEIATETARIENIITFMRSTFMCKLYLFSFVICKYRSREIKHSIRKEKCAKNIAKKVASFSTSHRDW